MKTSNIIIGIFLLISLVSCEQSMIEDQYCFNLKHNSLKSVILPKNQLDSIKQLFDYNHLDYSKFQFYRFKVDELGYHHVSCYQFKNNLKVFTNDLIFHFDKTNNYNFLSGELIEKVNLNEKFKMNHNSVITEFLNVLDQDKYILVDRDEIEKSCFDIEFGYYDLNAGKSNTSKHFTKAWKIKLSNRDYPYAYINDMNSDVISYDNGIRYY